MENLFAKKIKLADLVAYQSEAIVSRTIIDKPSGTFTIFSFDRGQGLSEHTAPYDAVVLVLDGTVEINIAGKLSQAEAGDMIIMPANQPHSLKAVDKFKMALIMIRS